MNKPSRHIDAAIEAIDRLFGEDDKDRLCWKCQTTWVPPKIKSGLCKVCKRNLVASSPACDESQDE